jgi:hypothetical protein
MAKGVAGSGYFQWNYKSSTIIRRKGFDKKTNLFFAKLLYKYSYPFTPYDPYRTSGTHMADNVRFMANNDHGTIVYQSNYAKYLHESKGWNFNKLSHPLATDHWEKYAWLQAKDFIIRDLDKYRKRRSKP